MCSRFALFKSKAEIMDELTPLLWTDDFRPNWNVAPTTVMPVIVPGDRERTVRSMSWGIIQPWNTSPIINARSETIHEKPTFKGLVEAGRFALVPMDVYFEWKHVGKKRIPYMIRRRDQALLCAAALWAIDSETMRFAIVTRPAQGELASLHHRMPLFIETPSMDTWLQHGTTESEVAPDLEMREIHPRINSVKTQGPKSIEIVPEQPELF